MNSFLFALQHLTRIYLKDVSFNEKDLGRSVMYFPLVGIIIGSILTALLFLSNMVFPPPATSAILVVLLVIITGGLHLDGFMDTMDGVLSGRSMERKLEIMKDSRVGAFGALGVACLLLLKFSLILSAPGELLPRLLLIMPVISRWAMAYAIAGFPYARPEGLGMHHVKYTGRTELAVATVTALALVAGAGGPAGLVLFLLAGPLTHLLCRQFSRQLGGLTGDTYGAANEIMEVAILLLFFPVYKFAGLAFLW